MNSFSARYQTHKSGRQTLYVEACWKAPHMVHRSYSVAKHGWLGAVCKAIAEREASQGVSLGINPRSLVVSLSRKVKQ